MSGSDDDRRQAWSAYWSSGRLHSCASGLQDNYGGAIGLFWRDVFTRRAAEGRVLDLATGNGPLPRLLWELRGDRAEVDAVDLAMLAPAWHAAAGHPGIRFHPGVRMEALPFADASFDCVASQFGFEYAQRDAAVAECLRVARPRATFAFVLHHAGSVLARVGRVELGHHARLLGDGGLVEAARGAIHWIARARAGLAVDDVQASSLARERYNAAMRDLSEAADGSPAPDLLLEARATIHRLLAGGAGQDAQSMRAALDLYAAELDGARLRTAEMVAHALDRGQLEQLAQAFRTARPGSTIECSEVTQAEGVLAWSLVVAPAAVAAG